MSNDTPVVILLEAGTAAEKLDVSASGLRRLSLIYEEVYEELPRKPKSNNRLWPQIAVERLQRARALLEAERYRTIQEALQAIKSGLVDEAEIEVPIPKNESTQESLQVLIVELKSLREELAATREQNMALQHQLSNNLVSSKETSNESLMVNMAKRFDSFIRRFLKR